LLSNSKLVFNLRKYYVESRGGDGGRERLTLVSAPPLSSSLAAGLRRFRLGEFFLELYDPHCGTAVVGSVVGLITAKKTLLK
jgi:hypothetical protein